METPVVIAGAPKPDVHKPAREARPPSSANRADALPGEASPDRTALSARSQAAAARARSENGADGEMESHAVRRGAGTPPPDGPGAADSLARETSRRIVGQPAAAARAQANSQAASVLSMLQ
jgi:hypothetical protein